MDKDDFDLKLRELKRQKSKVEEEFEDAQEKWRLERKRLNSDIDRLEGALADAKEARKKSADTKARGIDPVEVAKIQATADERIKKAAADWEVERGKFKAEIARLEQSVTEILERANNPVRATMSAKEQLQAQLDEALKVRRHLEDEFINAKEEWDKEKLKLTGEIIKARRGGGGKVIKGKLDEEDQTEELTKRLEEASRSRDALDRELKKATSDWEAERKKLIAAAEEARSQAQRAEAKPKDTSAQDALSALERDFKKAKTDWEAQRDKLVAEVEDARNKLQRAEAQSKDTSAQDALTALERDFKKAKADWEAQRDKLVAEAEDARNKLQRAEAQSKDTSAQDALSALERDFKKAKTDWEADRQRLLSDIEKGRQAAAEALSQQKESSGHAGQLREVMQERNVLRQEVDSAKDKLQALRKAQAEEKAQLEKDIATLTAQVQQLERTLGESQDKVSAEVVEQLRRQYDERLQQMIGEKTNLAEELKSASASLEAERKRFATAAAAAAPSAAAAGAVAPEKMTAEVARVEAMIAEIAQLIDDPATELSLVIRKNVERAELDAYLKGILFSLGKSRGL